MGNVVYRARVHSSTNGGLVAEGNYIGLSSTPFIERYRNHLHSFNSREKINATELSKFIWKLKDEGRDYNITWEIVRTARSYKPGGKYCNLCTSEALAIAFEPGQNCLNSRNEVIKRCRHRSKWKLDKFKKF